MFFFWHPRATGQAPPEVSIARLRDLSLRGTGVSSVTLTPSSISDVELLG